MPHCRHALQLHKYHYIYIYIYIYIIVIIILLDIITNLTNQRKKYSDLIFLKVMNYDIENTFEK